MKSAKATPPHIDCIRRVWEVVVLLSCLSCHRPGWRGFRNPNPQHADGYATNVRERRFDRNQYIAWAADGGRDAHKIQKGIDMKTEAMYGGRDVTCMMPQRFGCTGCRMVSGTAWSVFCILPVRYMDERLRG